MLGERDRRDSSTSFPARTATPESAGPMRPPSPLFSNPQAALDPGSFPIFGAKSDNFVTGNNMDVMATRQASLVIQEEPEQEQEFALGSEDKTIAVPAASNDTKRPEVHVIKRRNVGVPKFLRFLFQILEVEDPDIITWSHEGTAFQIINPEELANQILPKYFKHNKVSSFQRQLNYFGFKKWTKTQTNICTFSHPFFLRADKNRMKLIKRKERASPAIMSAAMAATIKSNPTDLMNQLQHFEAHDLAEARSQLPTQQALKRQKSNTLSGATVTFLNSAAAGRRHSTGMLPGSEAFGLAAAAAAAAAAAEAAEGSLPGRKRAGTPAEQELELEMEARADTMGQGSSAQQQFLYLQKIAEAKQLSQRYPYQSVRGKRQSLPHVLPPGFGDNFGLNMSSSGSNGGFGPRNVVNLGRRKSDQLLTDYSVGGGKSISVSQIEAFMSSSGTSSPPQSIFASSVKSDASVVLPVMSNCMDQGEYRLQQQQRQHQQQLQEQITRQQLNQQQNIYGGGGIYGSPNIKSWPAPIKTESSSGWPTSTNVSSSSAGSASYPPQLQNHSMAPFKYGVSNVPQNTVSSYQNGAGSMDYGRKLQQRPMMTHQQQYQARHEREYQQQEQERPATEEQPPRDYIDVLLENAGLDDTGNLPPATSTSESWDEPHYPHSRNGSNNSEGPYAFIQSQQQLSPMGNMPHNPTQRF